MITFSGNNSLRLCQYSVIYLKKSFLHRSKIPLKSVCSISYQMKYLNAIKSSENNLVFEGKTKYENTFGDIEKYELKYQRFKDDPEDLEEYSRQKAGQGKTVATYIKEISLALRNNDYKKGLQILEIDMINDYKPPITYLYGMLISYNGRLGNLKEAFRIYTNFKKRNGRVSGGMYTSLFNACANCSDSFYAIEVTNKIRNYMMNDKNHKVNLSNYNAMIKAYGRHGDLCSCFQVMDEVLEKKLAILPVTFSFLLQGCVSDKNSGLRHALLVWRKMVQLCKKPNLYIFNIMLRCIRECNFGELELITDLVKQIESESQVFYKRKVKIRKVNNEEKIEVLKTPISKAYAFETLLSDQAQSDALNTRRESLEISNSNSSSTRLEIEHQLNSVENIIRREESDNELQLQLNPNISLLQDNLSNDLELPNLLAPTPSVGSVIHFNSMTKPVERFMCFGGVTGFLKVMKQYGVKPNVKTFTMFLDLIPPTLEAEEKVMFQAKVNEVKLDSGFFNVLIKRRSFREGEITLKDTLKLMQNNNVSPDIITFGVLALGCTNHEDGIELIKSARSFGIRLNCEILGGLLNRAREKKDLNYVKTILTAAKEDETTLDAKFIATLSKIVKNEKLSRLQEEKIFMENK